MKRNPGLRCSHAVAGVPAVVVRSRAISVCVADRATRHRVLWLRHARLRPALDRAVARCIFSTTKNPVLLSVNGVDASRWSALYGWNTVILPANFGRLSAEHRKQFTTIYQITHVHLGDRIPSSLVWDGLGLKFQPECPGTVLPLAMSVLGESGQ